MKLIIGRFVPPFFRKHEFDLNEFNDRTGKKWIYASSGKACLYHIIEANALRGKILVPIYSCESILIPIREAGLEPIFYDLDLTDLNPSLDSIKQLRQLYDVSALLVVSLYGNPANLEEIEDYCRETGLFMIDDAAQSFGGILNNKLVGTFGNAGFFSFSPGKSTAGHCGGFFWTNTNYKTNSSFSDIRHFCNWFNFYVNRYKYYQFRSCGFLKYLSFYIKVLVNRQEMYLNDRIASFEEQIIGGILYSLFQNKFSFRTQYCYEFQEKYDGCSKFRCVVSQRGIPVTHKLVLIGDSIETSVALLDILQKNGIHASKGYALMTDSFVNVDNAMSVNDLVLEIPIEKDRIKMNYLISILDLFVNS